MLNKKKLGNSVVVIITLFFSAKKIEITKNLDFQLSE